MLRQVRANDARMQADGDQSFRAELLRQRHGHQQICGLRLTVCTKLAVRFSSLKVVSECVSLDFSPFVYTATYMKVIVMESYGAQSVAVTGYIDNSSTLWTRKHFIHD